MSGPATVVLAGGPDVDSGLKELEIPRLTTAAERVAWANDRQWDFAEGTLSRNALNVLCHVLDGWADLGSDEEKAQYRALARHGRTLLASGDS